MSDRVGNPEDRFSHNEAHILAAISEVLSELEIPEEANMCDIINKVTN